MGVEGVVALVREEEGEEEGGFDEDQANDVGKLSADNLDTYSRKGRGTGE